MMETQLKQKYSVASTSGYAGGSTSEAMVNIRVHCSGDTVEGVRQFVDTACNAHDALVDVLMACHGLYTDHPEGNDVVADLLNKASALVTMPERG